MGRVACAKGTDARRADECDAFHLRGGATKQMGPCRRNPPGGRGLRLHASLLVDTMGQHCFLLSPRLQPQIPCRATHGTFA